MENNPPPLTPKNQSSTRWSAPTVTKRHSEGVTIYRANLTPLALKRAQTASDAMMELENPFMSRSASNSPTKAAADAAKKASLRRRIGKRNDLPPLLNLSNPWRGRLREKTNCGDINELGLNFEELKFTSTESVKSPDSPLKALKKSSDKVVPRMPLQEIFLENGRNPRLNKAYTEPAPQMTFNRIENRRPSRSTGGPLEPLSPGGFKALQKVNSAPIQGWGDSWGSENKLRAQQLPGTPLMKENIKPGSKPSATGSFWKKDGYNDRMMPPRAYSVDWKTNETKPVFENEDEYELSKFWIRDEPDPVPGLNTIPSYGSGTSYDEDDDEMIFTDTYGPDYPYIESIPKPYRAASGLFGPQVYMPPQRQQSYPVYGPVNTGYQSTPQMNYGMRNYQQTPPSTASSFSTTQDFSPYNNGTGIYSSPDTPYSARFAGAPLMGVPPMVPQLSSPPTFTPQTSMSPVIINPGYQTYGLQQVYPSPAHMVQQQQQYQQGFQRPGYYHNAYPIMQNYSPTPFAQTAALPAAMHMVSPTPYTEAVALPAAMELTSPTPRLAPAPVITRKRSHKRRLSKLANEEPVVQRSTDSEQEATSSSDTEDGQTLSFDPAIIECGPRRSKRIKKKTQA